MRNIYHINFKAENWVKCDEHMISSLWNKWVVSNNTKRFIDEEGFMVFGNSIFENELKN